MTLKMIFGWGLFCFALVARAGFDCELVLHKDFEFDHPEIKQGELHNVYGLRNFDAALLTEGEDALAARIHILENAKRSIRIQALIITGDESGQRIASILKRKKEEGLDVRVIVDAVSNFNVKSQAMYYDLKQHGIEVEGYEAFGFQWLTEGSLFSPLEFNMRYHEKFVIVDGEDEVDAVAIMGGMNIANEYFRVGRNYKHKWRDQDMIVRGLIVTDITRAFEFNYSYLKGRKAALFFFNPDLAWKIARATIIRWAGKVKFPARLVRSKKVMANIERAIKNFDYNELEFVPVTGRLVQSRPRHGETYNHQALLSMINNADHELVIGNAYFVPPEEVRYAIIRAVKRGVKVTILTNSRETNDLPQMSRVSRFYYLELLEAAQTAKAEQKGGSIEIYEWSGKPFGEGTWHAKFAVTDRQFVMNGSHNLDPRSKDLNSESTLVLDSATVATEMAEHFFNIDLKKCHKITYEEAQEYRSPKKWRDRFGLWWARRVEGWL